MAVRGQNWETGRLTYQNDKNGLPRFLLLTPQANTHCIVL